MPYFHCSTLADISAGAGTLTHLPLIFALNYNSYALFLKKYADFNIIRTESAKTAEKITNY
jgi:hypothetical protein